MKLKAIVLFSILGLTLDAAYAEVRLPNVLTSNMVLQQQKKVAIWGKADPGEKVTVNFAGQTLSCIANTDSLWKVYLKPMTASFDAHEMSIKGENNEIKLQNILIGEVWLCGGQSNMEYPMDRTRNKYAAPKRGDDIAAIECKNVNDKNLRLFLVEKKHGLPDCSTLGWLEASPTSTAPFSAAAYYFGKTLQQELQVPIGIIASSWGGSRIENWISEDVYKNAPFYIKELNSHPNVQRRIALYYNTMIKSLAPYTLRGFTWYQGESDAMLHDSLYVEKFTTLLNNWRTIFEDDNLPMYFVQIAPYLYSKRNDNYKHDEWTKARFADLQTQCMNIPHTGQVIITDLVDDPKDIHPSYKWEVGRRLALWALAKDYKQKNLVYSGPQLNKVKLKNGNIILKFKFTGKGLTAGQRDDDTDTFYPVNENPTWFEVADGNGNFKSTDAEIDGNRIIINVSNINNPSAVRFGWNEKAMPNLFNSAGLPAIPFYVNLEN